MNEKKIIDIKIYYININSKLYTYMYMYVSLCKGANL